MYQSITIMGRLGQDPELRLTPSGSHVLTLNVAVNKGWQQAGEWKESTTWFKAVVWGERADQLEQRQLKKGDKVMVVGEMQPCRVYTASNGDARADLEMKANVVRVIQTAQGNHSSELDGVNLESAEPIPW